DDKCIESSDEYPWSYGLRLCIVTCQESPIKISSDVRFHMTRSIDSSNGAAALGSVTRDGSSDARALETHDTVPEKDITKCSPGYRGILRCTEHCIIGVRKHYNGGMDASWVACMKWKDQEPRDSNSEGDYPKEAIHAVFRQSFYFLAKLKGMIEAGQSLSGATILDTYSEGLPPGILELPNHSNPRSPSAFLAKRS
ncbi:hypothetical protein M752DRAFT_217434, partial [Aspergillus phoenicis ATCC 13157]